MRRKRREYSLSCESHLITLARPHLPTSKKEKRMEAMWKQYQGPNFYLNLPFASLPHFFCHISPRVLMNPNLSFFVPLLVLICPHLPSIVVDRPDLIIHFLVYSHLSSKAHIVLTCPYRFSHIIIYKLICLHRKQIFTLKKEQFIQTPVSQISQHTFCLRP